MAIGLMACVGLVGCGLMGSERACDPGAVRECPCLSGGQGVQTCRENSSGWEECQCRQSQVPEQSNKAPGVAASQNSLTLQGQIEAPNTPSTFILNPASDSSRAYRFSGAYACWNDGRLTGNDNHSWDGRLNIDLTRSEPQGNILTIRFITSYYAEPICNVNLEGFVGFTYINSGRDWLAISLFDINGAPRSWNSVDEMCVFVACHGVM